MKGYAHILHALADGKQCQRRACASPWGEWLNYGAADILRAICAKEPPDVFRIKPETININGHEVPAPLREVPAERTELWAVAILQMGEVADRMYWNENKYCIEWLARGLLHTTKEAAEAHARALLSFTEKAQ